MMPKAPSQVARVSLAVIDLRAARQSYLAWRARHDGRGLEQSERARGSLMPGTACDVGRLGLVGLLISFSSLPVSLDTST
jgi:hypothetical protein